MVEVVDRLIGEIILIGESREDNNHLENIKNMIALVNHTHDKLDEIAYLFSYSKQSSVALIGRETDKYIKSMNICE